MDDKALVNSPIFSMLKLRLEAMEKKVRKLESENMQLASRIAAVENRQ